MKQLEALAYKVLKKSNIKNKTWFEFLLDSYFKLKVITRKRTIKNYFKNHRTPKLHIGSGYNWLKGWLNTDIRGGDIYLNLLKKFPFKADSFNVIYSEHVIEHLPYESMPFILKECHRILKTGGTIRLSCPNLEIFTKMYLENNKKFFQILQEKGFDHKNIKTPAAMICDKFYGWGHRWCYDATTLIFLLKQAGFKIVTQMQYRETNCEDLKDLDQEDKNHLSLYIEATK